jgi:hypothetical protein
MGWKERLALRGLIIIIIMYVWATIYAFRVYECRRELKRLSSVTSEGKKILTLTLTLITLTLTLTLTITHTHTHTLSLSLSHTHATLSP